MLKITILMMFLMLTGCASYHETKAPCDAYRDTCHNLKPVNVQRVGYGK